MLIECRTHKSYFNDSNETKIIKIICFSQFFFLLYFFCLKFNVCSLYRVLVMAMFIQIEYFFELHITLSNEWLASQSVIAIPNKYLFNSLLIFFFFIDVYLWFGLKSIISVFVYGTCVYTVYISPASKIKRSLQLGIFFRSVGIVMLLFTFH